MARIYATGGRVDRGPVDVELRARQRTERQMRRLRHALTELLEGRPFDQPPTRRHVRGGMAGRSD